MNDEIKTVTHEGQVYQLGKYYLFRMHSVTWVFGMLEAIDSSLSCPFCTPFQQWIHIKEIPAFKSMGTITPAPIELVDGAAYTFDYHRNRNSAIGVYSKCHNTFLTVGHDYFVFDCSNIRLMTVESK
jgi:hypothetical protein